MIRSMTAFARVSAPPRDGKWVVEVRSVNNRFLDLSIKMPAALSSLENRVRELLSRKIQRGKVMVAVSQDLTDEKVSRISLNPSALKAYRLLTKKLSREFKVSGELNAADLLKLPGMITLDVSVVDAEKSWALLRKYMEKVLIAAVRAKETEGKKLAADIAARLKKTTESLARIEKLVEGRTAAVYEKLSERIRKLLDEKESDPDRVYREAAFLADRSDITEEIVRLRSHLDLFGAKLKSGTEVGRELDFLCQEMNREVNTIGSKAQLFDVSSEVVFMKGEFEKIREQVQNIE